MGEAKDISGWRRGGCGEPPLGRHIRDCRGASKPGQNL